MAAATATAHYPSNNAGNYTQASNLHLASFQSESGESSAVANDPVAVGASLPNWSFHCTATAYVVSLDNAVLHCIPIVLFDATHRESHTVTLVVAVAETCTRYADCSVPRTPFGWTRVHDKRGRIVCTPTTGMAAYSTLKSMAASRGRGVSFAAFAEHATDHAAHAITQHRHCIVRTVERTHDMVYVNEDIKKY